jgi:hypothetical protein
MRKQVLAWQCELDLCGHIWLAAGIDAPAKCAKCKRRGWHTKEAKVAQLVEQDSRKVLVAGSNPVLGSKPDMQALRDICAGKSPIPSGESKASIQEAYFDRVYEIPICGFRWWEDGEQFECLMDKGHSVPTKHGRNGMVRRVDE